MQILVVEDSLADMELLEKAFRELNTHAIIRVARDGAECLTMLFGPDASSRALPDLIFLDLTLPKISGHDVLIRIKSSQLTRHIPVIVLSGAEGDSEVERAYLAHANAYVRKPTSLADLLTAARGLKSFWMETARLPNTFAAP